MLEKDIERKACEWARANGWLAYKFTSPSRRSVPDRLFIKAGAVGFIEFKRPGGAVTDSQKREIARLDKEGMAVWVCHSVEDAIRVLGETILSQKYEKYDEEKPRWDLVPFLEMEEVVKVLAFGAEKYGDNNWTTISDAESRYFAAAMRHLVSWKTEDRTDSESGLPHLAHAICCLLFLMAFDRGNSDVE